MQVAIVAHATLRQGRDMTNMSVALVLLFAALCLPAIAAENPLGSADSARGARVLARLSCMQCHSMNGKGGVAAPDLGESLGRDFTPTGLIAKMWNHAPVMWASMRKARIALPALDEQAAGDIFAYFYSVRYFDKPGNPTRGKETFESKHCSACHGLFEFKARGVKPVTEWTAIYDPIALASAMWNHSTSMGAEFADRILERPILTSQNLADIVAYTRQTPGTPPTTEHMQMSSGRWGEKIFRSQGCAGCHKEKFPLTGRLKGKTMTDVAAAMWNHESRMAATSPQLTPMEMREIAAYLWATQFFQESGNAASGKRLFTSARCYVCHGGSEAPRLNGKQFSAITMFSALWQHGPKMFQQASAKNINWPTFSGTQMSDLIAYLNHPF